MVGYFNSSVVGVNEKENGLKRCQQSAGIPQNKLTQDVKTRWRSSHAMCNSLRINQEALLLFEVRNPNAAVSFKNNRYSLEDWLINNQTVALLAPLASASQYLEGKDYPTLNLVLPSLYSCIEHVNPASVIVQPWDGNLLRNSELRPEVQEARKQLYDDLVERWKTDIPETLKRYYMIATMLDPRQRELKIPGLSAVEKHQAKEWFISEYISLWDGKQTPAVTGNQQEQQGTRQREATQQKPAPQHPQHSGASFISFLSSLAHLQGPDTGAGEEQPPVSKSEAEKYLELDPVPMQTDILKWWAAKESSFPNLSCMARQYLGCPATSASAERLFSIAGRVYDDLRQNMDTCTLEEIMWARINRANRKRKA